MIGNRRALKLSPVWRCPCGPHDQRPRVSLAGVALFYLGIASGNCAIAVTRRISCQLASNRSSNYCDIEQECYDPFVTFAEKQLDHLCAETSPTITRTPAQVAVERTDHEDKEARMTEDEMRHS